jgi:hypothetical protein
MTSIRMRVHHFCTKINQIHQQKSIKCNKLVAASLEGEVTLLNPSHLYKLNIFI